MSRFTRPSSFRRRLATAIVAVTAVGSTAVTSTADAGEISPADVVVNIAVTGPSADDVLAGLTIELWPDRATEPVECSDEPEPFPGASPVLTYDYLGCLGVEPGTYSIGLDGVPDGFSVIAECTSSTPENIQPNEVIPGTESFEVLEFRQFPASCLVSVFQPIVLVDKIVDGGSASIDDFTIEVYSSEGDLVATGVDPSAESCVPQNLFTRTAIVDPLGENCAVIGIQSGDHQLGEVAVPGYAPTNVGCRPYAVGVGEVFPEGIGAFSIEPDPIFGGPPIVLCEITNSYFEGSVTVAKQVVNDDGGTATADDFTAELYLEGGALVESGACAADGSCIDTDLPIGDYRVGESGPEGYASTVACTVTGGSVPEIGTVPPSIPLFDEAIAGESAAFTLQPDASVACVITNDDVAPAIGVLPPTGTNRQPLVLALVLLALGGSLVALRRRPA